MPYFALGQPPVSRRKRMFGFSPMAIIIILLLILIIFGAGKLPEIGSSLGKGIKNFKRAIEGKDEIEVQARKDDDPDKKA
jgi:sec-independent protein translocase protein TatA